jgi:hypothetical protein
MKVHRRPYRVEIGPGLGHVIGNAIGKPPEILVDGHIEIGQIIAVKNNALGIGFGIPDPEGKRKRVIGSIIRFGHDNSP